IAAEDELQFQITIGIRVGETEIDFRRSLVGAALEAGERHFRRPLRGGREADESVGADANRQQGKTSLHGFPPHRAKEILSTRGCCPDAEDWSTRRRQSVPKRFVIVARRPCGAADRFGMMM